MAGAFRAVRRIVELLKEFDGRLNNLENVGACRIENQKAANQTDVAKAAGLSRFTYGGHR
jgi:hypothetical protein